MKRSVKILQFGEGNFLRAFADYIIDKANVSGVLNTDVCIVNPLPTKLNEQFKISNFRYNVAVQGILNDARVDSIYKVNCVADALSPQYEIDAYNELIISEDLRFVISNTTEAGIVFDDGDDFSLPYPRSFPGKVTKLLYTRFEHFKADADKGLHFIPVELIDANGDTLKNCVIALAKLWKLPNAFLEWIDTACTFANTLVDRIVSGYPKGNIEKFDEKLQYHDGLLVVTEPFYLWVIDADERLKKELPLNKVTNNVIFVPDIRPYRERKVRLLNGGHTTLTPVALLSGKKYVRECMADGLLSAYLDKAVSEEIIPTVTSLPKTELEKFYRYVRERFANPFMDHSLESISLNTVSKFHTRVLPSIEGYFRSYNKLPSLLTFAFAATLEYMAKAENFNDTPKVLEFIAAHKNDDAKTLTEASKEIFDIRIDGFFDAALCALLDIRESGIIKALEKRL